MSASEILSHNRADQPKVLYIIISDEENVDGGREQQSDRYRALPPPRYTRSVLQSTLQLMGCKARHAFKISDRVFDVFCCEILGKKAKIRRHHSQGEPFLRDFADKENAGDSSSQGSSKRATVSVSRVKFLDVVCDALSEYQYVGPKQRADLLLACRVRERKTSVTVLICGTSGCGKSTLSSLLASRLGITTVVSTDSVRHMMRSFVSEKENPLLWASTYHAGECLDPVAIAEAKTKKKVAKNMSTLVRNSSLDQRSSRSNGSSGVSNSSQNSTDKITETVADDREQNGESSKKVLSKLASDGSGSGNTLDDAVTEHEPVDTKVGSKTVVVQGFKAQSEMVIDSLDRLITAWELKNESVVVEGVHLSLSFVMGLMKKHPSIVPFMVYISNEGKHLERFAVRAKYMTLDPAKNKYVKYIRNIRTIQEYLCKRADKHLVPKVINTNVDKSIAIIHATIFSCLRRQVGGDPLYDQATNTVKVVDQEYKSQYAASSLGSKGMFQLIQRRGSSRHLMALMNVDGSVAKAWPIDANSNRKPASGSSSGPASEVGVPVYGPLAIGKSEAVNLQFGNLGLSAWLTDTGAASHTSKSSSIDEHSSRGEAELNSSFPGSSCSSSPKHLEGGAKELSEEIAVSGSDEEPDEEELREVDSDGDAVDFGQELVLEGDGSVDDQSERSDEDDDYVGNRQLDDAFWPEDPSEGGIQPDQLTSKTQNGIDGIGHVPDRIGGRLRSQKQPPIESLQGLPLQVAERRLNTIDCPNVLENHSHSRSKSFPN